MPSLSSGGSSFLQDLAKLTWTFGDSTDNNDNYVTVFDVTGSGVITGIWASCQTAGKHVEIKLTIDGSIKWENEHITGSGILTGLIGLLIYFGTSAKLEMRTQLAGAADAKYYGVVGVQ